jgi:hypothetical protein
METAGGSPLGNLAMLLARRPAELSPHTRPTGLNRGGRTTFRRMKGLARICGPKGKQRSLPGLSVKESIARKPSADRRHERPF